MATASIEDADAVAAAPDEPVAVPASAAAANPLKAAGAAQGGHPQPHPALHFVLLLRRAAASAMDHDALTLSQATAYSAMVAIFPALIVAAAVVALLPDSLPLRFQMAGFFDRILPSNVIPLFEAYFATTGKTQQTAQALLGSLTVSVLGASNVVFTLMEGFRRAHDLPLVPGSFWHRRRRALALVPLSLLPMTAASALVVFGHLLTHWLAVDMASALRPAFYVFAFVLRWTISLAGSVGIIAVIYHLGTDLSKHMRKHMEPWLALHVDWSWRSSLPGATVATALWFLSTLGFGLYVTRFANYSKVYGSLGAAIALMFWLYIIALSVLIGSEYNAQLAAERRAAQAAPLSTS